MQIAGELLALYIKSQVANSPLSQGQGGTRIRGSRAIVRCVLSEHRIWVCKGPQILCLTLDPI